MKTEASFKLHHRHILLGITGGIAAYKSAELLRRLQDEGAMVRVVMTRAATEFITPLTLQALSGKPVHLDLLDAEAEAGMGHIELARWADVVLIAPASADFISRLAEGRADDLLTAICLATTAPLVVAPAMNQQMWKNPATQENCKTIRARGVQLLGPAEGIQACGETGPGRLLDIDDIRLAVRDLFSSGLLAGQRVVITAGPTREALDPVRYLSNHSSGKMGYALAQAALDAGASVCLISGPTGLTPPDRAEVIPVISAADMHAAALREASRCSLFIAAAAVADFRPASRAAEKIKKGQSENITLELVKNPDIVADVRKQFPKLYVVGFAAETQNVENNARDKLERKNLDMVIANDVSRQDIGFGSEQNAVTVFLRGHSSPKTFDVMAKSLLARHLVELMASNLTRS